MSRTGSGHRATIHHVFPSCIADGTLDVVDVLPLQLQTLRNKLPPGSPVRLLTMNAVDLSVPDCSYERTLIFFLLHEQPEAVRRRTLQEALRATLTWVNIEWMNGSRLEPDPHPD